MEVLATMFIVSSVVFSVVTLVTFESSIKKKPVLELIFNKR